MKSKIPHGLIALACLLMTGCATIHYRVGTEAIAPENLEPYKNREAENKAIIQVVNFVVNSVQANYSDSEKELFRKHNSVGIANTVFNSLGSRKVFFEVTRLAIANPASADYVVSGVYDFIHGSGNTGREWIPFADVAGLKTHAVWTKGSLHLRVVNAKTGASVLDKVFVEERRDEAATHQAARVTYLQPDFIAGITSEIKQAILKDIQVSQPGAAVPSAK